MSYKLGIIGAGFLISNRVLPALQEVDDFEVACVLDTNPATLDALRKVFPIGSTTTSRQEFFDQPLDAVYIATPNSTHLELVEESLDRGYPTLIEKPLADTLAAATTIVEKTKQASCPAMVGYMSKRNVYNQKVLEIVRSGQIGALVSMTARHGFEAEISRRNEWRFHRELSGFGVLSDMGIYPIITARELFGAAPIRTTAHAYPAADPTLSMQHVSALLEYPGNRTLQFTCSFYESAKEYTLTCESGVIHVEGIWSIGRGKITLHTHHQIQPIELDFVNSFAEEFRCFARVLDGNPVPEDMSIGCAFEDMTVLDALAKSAQQNGIPVNLSL